MRERGGVRERGVYQVFCLLLLSTPDHDLLQDAPQVVHGRLSLSGLHSSSEDRIQYIPVPPREVTAKYSVSRERE